VLGGVVALRTKHSQENQENIFATKWYVTLCIEVKPIVGNSVGKLEFYDFF